MSTNSSVHRGPRLKLRRQLRLDGWNDRAIASMVASKQWVRIRAGAYVDAGAWRALDLAGKHELRVRAVLLQSKTKLIASHCSAMPFYEGPTWGLDLDRVHGTRMDGKAGRCEAGVQQHRGAIRDGDVVERHGVSVMSAARTGLEVTTVVPTEAALVAVNHLLHAGHTTVEEMRERYEQGMVFWKGTLATDLVLRLADASVESVGESRFFYFCYAHGLPAPMPQYEVYDDAGQLIGRVDFAWPELGIFVEFDGRVKYEKLLKPGQSASDVVVREKRREERIVEATGWVCIRVTWADLENPEALLERIGRAMGRRARIA